MAAGISLCLASNLIFFKHRLLVFWTPSTSFRRVRARHFLVPFCAEHHYHPFTASMPLVVPDMSGSNSNDKTQEWMGKLAGKKLGDSHDSTVRPQHRDECSLLIVLLPDIRDERPATRAPCVRTRFDVYDGLQAEQVRKRKAWVIRRHC